MSVGSEEPPITRQRRRRSRTRLVAAGASFLVFGVLALIVRRNPTISADVSTTIRVQRRQHPMLTRVMSSISWLGFRPQSLILPGVLVSGFWFTRQRRNALFLVAAWGASMVSFTTKRLVMRPRPGGTEITVVEAGLRDSSFPSGHVLHYVVFWGFACYLWNRTVQVRALRRIPVAIVGTLIGAVGISRVYLGHHWLTDVIGSYSLGAGILLSLVGLHMRNPQDGNG
jgi:membrane-associated phospholipid phosphatase